MALAPRDEASLQGFGLPHRQYQAGDHIRQFRGNFGERFVPDYQRQSTVDFLMNAPFEE
jgi:hypothetical protein